MADGDVRVDKWLWAARLLKTRADAAEAARGGRVHVDGRAVKASYAVKLGDRIALRLGTRSIEVDVRGLSDKRGPAPVARELYCETEDSVLNRERHAQARRLGMAGPGVGAHKGGRPTKRDRRRYERGV